MHMTGILRRLLLLNLLTLGCAHGQPFHPDQLPTLQPAPQMENPSAGASRIGWQLHQQLSYSPAAREGTFSLNPSVNFVVHDPQAVVNAEILSQDAAVLAAENSDRSARSALELHQQFLTLQSNLWFQDFLLDWLDHWHALPPAAGAAPDREITGLMAAEAMLLEADDAIELQLLQLSVAGVPVMERPEAFFRPMVTLPDEPLAACLTGSRELRRLDLLRHYDVLDSNLNAAGRQQRIELNVGASVALSGSSDPDLGWNIGLRMSRADHAGAQLGFETSPGMISQSLTLRPAAQEAEPEAPDLSVAADLEAIRLLEMLLLSEQAARQEDLRKRTADLEMAEIRSRIESGDARRGDLQAVLDTFIELAQAVGYRDWLLLSLAVECRLPATYQLVNEYP